MCDIKACRICLRNETKFYNLDEFNLKQYYEEVTKRSINKTDGLPQYFCYECAALLYKFHLFREKCDYGEKILKDMLYNGLLTHVGISKMNTENLYRPKFLTLNICLANERFKVLDCHHIEDLQTKPEPHVPEYNNEELTGGLFSDYDNFVCDNLESNSVGVNFSYDVVKTEKVEDVVTIINDDKNETVQMVKIELNPVDNHPKVKQEEDTTTLIDSRNLVASKLNLKDDCASEIGKSEKITGPIKSMPQLIDLNNKTDDIKPSKIESEKLLLVKPSKKKRKSKFKRQKSRNRHFPPLKPENWDIFNLSDEDAMKEFQKKALDKKYLNALYKCDLCYRWFSQKSMLDRHMPKKHDEAVGPHECRLCKSRFKNRSNLVKHQEQHYVKYKCRRCGLACSVEDSAANHEELHSGVKRKCPHCATEFQHVSTFYTHMRTHRSKHVCALCGDSFVSELGLHMHKTAKHKHEAKNTVIDVEEAKYCEVCKINFESENAYQNHLDHSAMHIEEYKEPGAEKMEEEEKEEKKEEAYTPVGKLLNRISGEVKELSAVRKSVNTRKCVKNRDRVTTWTNTKISTTCKYCNIMFESASACYRHHIAEHRGKRFPSKRIVCEVCGKEISVCSIRSHMDRHTRLTAPHAQQKPDSTYICDTCGRNFSNKSTIYKHMVTHSGEKNHACTLCDKRYTQSGSLTLHYNTIHLKQPYPKRNRQKKNIE